VIAESFSCDEKEMMLGSLRQATKNTMFDQWLEAVKQPLAGEECSA
jgi:zinc finger-like protein